MSEPTSRWASTYHYAPPNCPLGTTNPEVRPACIVERTRGDRRLGSHVLAGLELLLPLLIDPTALTTDKVRVRLLSSSSPARSRSKLGFC